MQLFFICAAPQLCSATWVIFAISTVLFICPQTRCLQDGILIGGHPIVLSNLFVCISKRLPLRILWANWLQVKHTLSGIQLLTRPWRSEDVLLWGKKKRRRSENTVKVPLWVVIFSLVNFVNFFNLNFQPQSQEFWVPALRRRQSAVSFSIKNKRGSSLDNLSRWDKDAVCGSALDNRSRSDSLWRRRLTSTLWLISFSGLISLLILSLKRLAVLTSIFFYPASSF